MKQTEIVPWQGNIWVISTRHINLNSDPAFCTYWAPKIICHTRKQAREYCKHGTLKVLQTRIRQYVPNHYGKG